jgi:hypothetical protein
MNYIAMDFREIEFGDVDWTDLAQERMRWRAVGNRKLFSSCRTGDLSRKAQLHGVSLVMIPHSDVTCDRH